MKIHYALALVLPVLATPADGKRLQPPPSLTVVVPNAPGSRPSGAFTLDDKFKMCSKVIATALEQAPKKFQPRRDDKADLKTYCLTTDRESRAVLFTASIPAETRLKRAVDYEALLNKNTYLRTPSQSLRDTLNDAASGDHIAVWGEVDQQAATANGGKLLASRQLLTWVDMKAMTGLVHHQLAPGRPGKVLVAEMGRPEAYALQ